MAQYPSPLPHFAMCYLRADYVLLNGAIVSDDLAELHEPASLEKCAQTGLAKLN